MNKAPNILDRIDALVSARGLLFLGIVALGEDPAFDRFQDWLARNYHAGMGFLKNHQALRRDPRMLGENLQTAIVVGLNYFQGDKKNDILAGKNPVVAQYSRLKDYHKVIRDLGGGILNELPEVFGRPVNGRVTTDSAPILERSHAARAGKGFVGKNTCFIVPKFGSFLLLGEILIDAVIDEVKKAVPTDSTVRSPKGGCGTCRRCQVHCPTGALDQAWVLDANKCLAYWSIEHRGLVPYEYWRWFKVYLFGCDICQLVCPYNRDAIPTPHTDMIRVDAVQDLFQVATMNQQEYERLFGGTPLTRAKREGLIRNALIAMTVSKHPRLSEAIAFHQHQPVINAIIAGTIDQITNYKE